MILRDFAEQVTAQTAAGVEETITETIGITFRETVSVEVRKPRWMPGRMYRWLMRTIVVTRHRP